MVFIYIGFNYFCVIELIYGSWLPRWSTNLFGINTIIFYYFFFQNTSLAWDVPSQPDLTPCFEKTVLVWVPCGFLWIFGPVEAYFLIKNCDRYIPTSFLNVAKLVSHEFLGTFLSLSLVRKLCNHFEIPIFYYYRVGMNRSSFLDRRSISSSVQLQKLLEIY